jgi:ATP-dependent DNA ligase
MRQRTVPLRPCRDLIKVKCMKAMTLAIIGYVPAKGKSIAARRLARRDGAERVYAGQNGFLGPYSAGRPRAA